MHRAYLVAAVLFISAWAACAQRPLEVIRDDAALTARGDHFAATWQRDAGWQLARVEVEDFDGQFRIDSQRDGMSGMLGLAIRQGERLYTTHAGQAEAPEVVEQTKDKLVFDVAVQPRTADGQPCALRVSQRFTVMGEGAIFSEFRLTPVEGAGEATIDDIATGMVLDTGVLKQLRWHWKHTWRGLEDLASDAGLEDRRYLRAMGATVGRTRPYTNQIEMCLERRLSLTGDGETGMWCEVTGDEGDAKRFAWHLGGPVQVGAGFTYENRCGIALGHARIRDNAVGQRVAHWQEGSSALMTYPSDSALDAMAACGVSINVLHLYWYRSPAYSPFDTDDMRRWIAGCHARGIKAIVYATPTDREGLAGINPEWVQDLGLDGVYFDFGSLHTLSGKTGRFLGDVGRDFPGLGGVELTRRFREAVGEDGIIISHSGGYAPDTFFHLNLNAYLPGEAGVQRSMLTDFRSAAYHSGMAYAVVHPWCEYAEFQTKHGAASYCAMGGFPHILFGRGTHQDNNYHRSVYRAAEFVLPYWQILSLIPMDDETALYTSTTTAAATADVEAVRCCVYQRSPDLLLITAANLGEACEATVTLDRKLLELEGTYRVLKLAGDDVTSLAASDAGSWESGPIALGHLETDDYLGLLLYRGELPDHSTRELARIDRLRASFADADPPSVPSGLKASSQPGTVELSWEASADGSHVVEYRLYRGTGGDTPALLAAVEEDTKYRDYTAQPGVPTSYVVSAVDVAGNESARSQPVQVTPPGEELSRESLTAVNGYWKLDGEWILQGMERSPAGPEGDTIEFPARTVNFVRAYFTGGMNNFGCAHIVEMEARDAAGKRIAPARITSSGDDAGHPASFAADGNTDKNASAWWSDRNKPMPSWVAFEFAEPASISSVWLLTFWDDIRWYDYAVEVSQDGQEWTPVAATGATRGPVANARILADATLKDGTVGVTTLEIDPQRTGGGLLFRCPDPDNGYSLTLEPRWDGNIVLDKLVDGKLKRLAALFFPFSIHNPIPHRISVECKGNVIKCYCDGVLALEITDDSFSEGKVGLIVPGGGRVQFSRFMVGE